MAPPDAVAEVQNDLSKLRDDVAQIEHDAKQGFLDAIDMIQEKVALLTGHEGSATSPQKQFDPKSPESAGPIGASTPPAGAAPTEPPAPPEETVPEPPPDAPPPSDPAVDAPADTATTPPPDPTAPGEQVPPPPPPADSAGAAPTQ